MATKFELMYREATIRAITEQRTSAQIEMKRGIRQGCPMSPLLFAMYTEPITQALKEMMEQTNKKGEPVMLMNADYMVLWGNTKQELQEKW